MGGPSDPARHASADHPGAPDLCAAGDFNARATLGISKRRSAETREKTVVNTKAKPTYWNYNSKDHI